MLGMNAEQWKSLLRQALLVFGGIAVTFGWLTQEQLNTILTNLTAIAGPLVILGTMIWGLVARSRANLVVAAAQQNPEVLVQVPSSAPAAVLKVARESDVPNVVRQNPPFV